ncbi:phosphoadenosine phosphosulfate reductase, thioredoxin dependent [Xenococcus sp. PCC 7305]|nr:phosphoadenylyl-sulfate reductase [Xenococcus sp. PCC 7305]ELS00573.1 phosphoadenosine phosphosulfate reductase, thioredoxin dependent [Xenococcus sp. PCC 7305]
MISASRENSKLNSSLINQKLDDSEAIKLVKWSDSVFRGHLIMTTSFGIQSAVMLHLVTRLIPNIPVVWIDTGYFPKATYQFAEELTQRLNLNLKVYQSHMSQSRMEALYGKLWERDDVEALNRYDYIRKVEPMQRALKELDVKGWLAGLRSNQTQHRQTLGKFAKHGDIYKIHPILNWHSKDIYQYLTTHNLPYHPYFDLGYVTVGDWHSSRPLTADDNHERDTRFNGRKQECGLHLAQNSSAESNPIAKTTGIYEEKAENRESQKFYSQDLDFLALTAQWCLKKLESISTDADSLIKIELLTQITEELKVSIKSVNSTEELPKEEVADIANEEEKKYFDIINDSTKNLISLVDDILNLAPTENQDILVESSPMPLEAIYEQVVHSLNSIKEL